MKLLNQYTIGPMALVGSWILRAWYGSPEYRYVVPSSSVLPQNFGRNAIYLFWHENLLYPAYAHGRQGVSVLISNHTDGEVITRIVNMMGIGAVRGSTRKKGFTALRNLIRKGKSSHLALTPDGPRGPRRTLQSGCIYLASRNAMPIVPVGIAAEKCWRVKSWDRLSLPKPGTRVFFVMNEAIEIPPDIDGAGIEQFRERVQVAMNTAQDRADRIAEGLESPATLSLSQVRGEWP